MTGILSAAGYVPYWRLQRSEIVAFMGGGGGPGTRSVASHDEDATTMGVEAARLALKGATSAAPDALWFSTTSPTYLDKTNATAIHAALGMASEVPAFDFGGALRSSTGALLAALQGRATTLVVSADLRDGLPTSGDESGGGDGAAALLVGGTNEGRPVLAEYLGGASVTGEMVERWRRPGERRSKVWEERFGETRYAALGREAWERATKEVGIGAEDIGAVAVCGMHARALRSLSGRLGVAKEAIADDLTRSVGQTGTAHPGLVLASMLETEALALAAGDRAPGRVFALVHLADGADVLFFRTTEALASWAPFRPVAAQIRAASDLTYAKFLSWRGMLTPEPPRRPEPQRVSSPAAWRSEHWKFGFVGSRDRTSGAVHLPPSRISMKGGALDEMDPAPMADLPGKVVTYTVDRLVYSPSPPVVFAVVDFEGGGRFPLELTDVDADTLAIGDEIEMTFRRLYSADDIHDYFWKGRPVPPVALEEGPSVSGGATGERSH